MSYSRPSDQPKTTAPPSPTANIVSWCASIAVMALALTFCLFIPQGDVVSGMAAGIALLSRSVLVLGIVVVACIICGFTSAKRIHYVRVLISGAVSLLVMWAYGTLTYG